MSVQIFLGRTLVTSLAVRSSRGGHRRRDDLASVAFIRPKAAAVVIVGVLVAVVVVVAVHRMVGLDRT